MNQEDLSAGGNSVAARLAREIRNRRLAAGLSQPELAKLIGYTRQYVSLAERHRQGLLHGLVTSELACRDGELGGCRCAQALPSGVP
ncbi:helix-turn-helix transcriptional regulator [Actinosynnema sp. CA-299493]